MRKLFSKVRDRCTNTNDSESEAVKSLAAGNQVATQADKGIQRLKNVAGLACQHPQLVLIPLCVLGLIVGLGTWGLLQGRRNWEDNTRAIAQSDGYTAIKTLQTGLYSAMMPVVQMAARVHLTPDFNELVAIWNSTAAVFMEAAPAGSMGLLLMPQGRVTSMYPDPLYFSQFNGWDLLQGDTRPAALGLIEKGNMSVVGPIYSPTATFYFVLPIFIRGVEANETWGTPTTNVSDCPLEICYNNATKTKWWGFVALVVDQATFPALNEPIAYLEQDLDGDSHEVKYHVQLRKPNPYPANTFVSFVPDEPAEPPSNAEVVTITVADDTWYLYLWLDRWTPVWMLPLVTIVVLGGLVIATLVFLMMLSRQEHHALLHSLLPESAIKRIRAEVDWTGANKKNDMSSTHIETPAQNMLSIIATALEGHVPPVHLLIAVKEALDTSSDVYRPNAEQLRKATQKLSGTDDEVRQALVRQLLGSANQTTEGAAAEDGEEDGCKMDVKSIMQEEGLEPVEPISAVRAQELDTGDTQLTSKTSHSHRAPARPTLDQMCSTPLGGSARYSFTSNMQSAAGPTVHQYVFGVPAVLKPGAVQYALALLMNKVPDGVPVQQHFKASNNLLFSRENIEVDATGNAAIVISPGATEGWEDSEFRLEYPIADKLAAILSTANDWAFDAFALDEATGGFPLSALGYWLIHSTGLMNWAGIDASKMVNFLRKIEAGYSDSNPYHNRRHAADVLQSVHVIIHRGGLKNTCVDNLSHLALYLAAIVHDYEHRGRNNDFLVNAHDDLAVRYNDIAPMENHHLAAAFGLLKNKDYNFFGPKFLTTSWMKLRKLIIELVLSTDMKRHFQILTQYEGLNKVSNTSCAPAGPISRLAQTEKEGSNRGGPAISSDNEKLLSMQMVLKCSDLGHLTSPLPVHLRWVRGLEEEFFQQGDEERKRNLPISPLCDRTKAGITKSQVGFFEFVAQPLFKHFTDRHHQAMPLLQALETNLGHWKAQAPAPPPTEPSNVAPASNLTERPSHGLRSSPAADKHQSGGSSTSTYAGPHGDDAV